MAEVVHPERGDSCRRCGWRPHPLTEVLEPQEATFRGRKHEAFGTGLGMACEVAFQFQGGSSDAGKRD